MEGVIGSSIAPKNFPSRSGKFGASQGDAVTQAQPLTQVANPGVPAFSAYGQQGQTQPDPTQADPLGGGTQDLLKQLRANRGGNTPFFGQMF